MKDIILVSVFILGAAVYLCLQLRKKIRALRDSKASPGCSCGCGCSPKEKIKNLKKHSEN